MSNIIIFADDQHIGHYFESLFSQLIDNEVQITTDIDEVKECIQKDEAALLVVDYNSKLQTDLIDFVYNKPKATPCFIIGDKDGLWKAKKKYKTKALLEYIDYDTSLDRIESFLTKMLKATARRQKKQQYCKVNISFFYATNEVFCDVYLNLKEGKYVKILNRYDQVDFDDLKKYERKNVRYLYVKDRDFEYITKQMVKQLNVRQNPSELSMLNIDSTKVNALFSMQLQETVAESVKTIGLNDDTVEMTSIAINTTIGLVKQDSKAFDMLQAAIQGQSYISEHSFLLAFLSSATCKASEFNNEESVLALTIAAFFHDIALESDEMAIIQTEHERDFERLGITEQNDYLSHIKNAMEIVSEIEGIPNAALTVISEHHEQYDGTGFPRGIDFKKIGPLSSIFNICHELSLYVYESGTDKDNIEGLLGEMEKTYTQGHYAKALVSLREVLGLTRPEVKKVAS